MVEQDHCIEKDKLHDDTHTCTTYRILTLRAKCIIEMVLSLLGPTLYAIKVFLGQVRIQNKYLLHIAFVTTIQILTWAHKRKQKEKDFLKK